MAFSYQNYTGNNATTTFSIPFTYTDTSEISVTVDGVAETGLTFPSSSEVTLTSAPASGTLVQVRRTTSLTARAVDFASGSVLTEEDLDNSSIQTFHASQEANDRANDAIAFDADGKWDAQNKVIKNLATPTDANDATNKSYVDTSANNAASSAAAALVSQNASAASATASANSATASAGSATTSANKASNSADSATASAASAATATTQAALATSNGAVQVALATTQADNAASSATTAATQATLATTNGAAQVALATTQANLATTNGAAQVALATTQANNAASSASTAATQATASASSASTSATQATNSANSATASANSATSASSAQTAAESARDATLAAYDNFDDRYLGAKSSSPTVDNDGNALIAGSLFFDTTNEAMKIYTGSAWVAAYVTGADFIPTSGGGISGDLAFGDNNKAIFGAGNDLQIYHDSGDSYIAEGGSGTGSLKIKANNLLAYNNSDVPYFQGITGGTFRIYHNGSTKLATTSTGVNVTGNATFADNGKAIFGAGSDLQVYHDGSNSYVKEIGTGDLILQGVANVRLQGGGNNENMVVAAQNGAVTLYHNNSPKLATTASGIDVTGGLNTTANVGIGASETSLFNAAGGTAKLVVTGSGTDTNIAANTDASVVISNTSTSAGNTSGLHFARADTDNAPNYAGASIVAQFPDAQATGQYPRGELAFLTSNSANTAPTEAMRIRGDLVGIGTTAPNFPLSFGANIGKTIALFENGGSSVYGIGMGGAGSAGDPYRTKLFSNGAERIAITDAGNVGIGTVPNANAKLHVSGGRSYFASNSNAFATYLRYNDTTTGVFVGSPAAGQFRVSSSSGASRLNIDSSGNATFSGNVTAYSDERLKSDITTIDNALDKVTAMRGVTFTKDGEAGSGVIAQELEKIAPELVMEGEEYKSVAYGNLVGYLIEAVKELSAKVEELENGSSD